MRTRRIQDDAIRAIRGVDPGRIPFEEIPHDLFVELIDFDGIVALSNAQGPAERLDRQAEFGA